MSQHLVLRNYSGGRAGKENPTGTWPIHGGCAMEMSVKGDSEG